LAWLTLLGCLLLAGLPIAVRLRGLPPVTMAENQALAQSEASWAHFNSDRWSGQLSELFDGLVPIADGQAALDRPPGRTWLHLLTFSAMDEPGAHAATLRLHARWASAGAALLAVASVFWAGYSIGGPRSASLAGLVAGTSPAMLFFGRVATTTMPLVASLMLAVAAALWAMRPFRPSPSAWRQASGWALVGLALAAAVLLAGLTAGLAAVVPLAVLLLLCPRRMNHLIGLAASMGLATLAIGPWVLYVHQNAPAAWVAWLGGGLTPAATAPGELAALVSYRLGLLLILALPWSIWLVAGLVQPFSKSSVTRRGRLMLGWSWFVAMAALLLPEAGPTSMALVPLLAVTALLVGQGFEQFMALSAEGRHARFWRWGRWGQLALLAGLSLAVPMVLAGQDQLMSWGLIDQRWLAPLHWAGAGAAGLVLLGVAGLSARFAVGHHPGRAVVCWAVWTALATTLLLAQASQGPALRYPMV
jgi:4-amino-4-deoxy-L-arabinose transferase-like glycosyltransferase